MRRRHFRGSRLVPAAGILAALAAAAFATWTIATRESSTPASIEDAVGRFRAGGRTLPPKLRGRVPPPGAYVYATHGYEQTDAVGTRRHDYPARTTITVVAGGCGARQRWDALQTRWDAVELCPRDDGGLRLASSSEEHEFFGHRDRRTYRCTPTSTYRPARLLAGTTWSSRCTIEGTTTADRGTVVGPRTLRVDGRRVRTVLLQVHTRVSGDTDGIGLTLNWVLPGTGLVVRRVVANASTTGTVVGDVTYVERFTLRLTSLRPRR